jgi:phage repressor protein C with HTH and peptisase S24 domain
MEAVMRFSDQILMRLEELGLNVNQAEARAGFPQGYIRGVVRDDDKRATPNIEKAEAISRALGLEFYYGPPRDLGNTDSIVIDNTDYARIPLHDVVLAAGAGAENGAELAIDHLAFRRDWLRRIGVSPDNARLARVYGDSMTPTLADNDLIMIDTSQCSVPARPRVAGRKLRADLYALVEDGLARVKRIEHSTFGTYVLHSDNVTIYAPEVLTGLAAHELNIIGKVVWWGHTEKG